MVDVVGWWCWWWRRWWWYSRRGVVLEETCSWGGSVPQTPQTRSMQNRRASMPPRNSPRRRSPATTSDAGSLDQVGQLSSTLPTPTTNRAPHMYKYASRLRPILQLPRSLRTATMSTTTTTTVPIPEWICILPDNDGAHAARLEARPLHFERLQKLSGFITFGGTFQPPPPHYPRLFKSILTAESTHRRRPQRAPPRRQHPRL